jgi:hypothetical protein
MGWSPLFRSTEFDQAAVARTLAQNATTMVTTLVVIPFVALVVSIAWLLFDMASGLHGPACQVRHIHP